jgi:hypothetical protein
MPPDVNGYVPYFGLGKPKWAQVEVDPGLPGVWSYEALYRSYAACQYHLSLAHLRSVSGGNKHTCAPLSVTTMQNNKAVWSNLNFVW